MEEIRERLARIETMQDVINRDIKDLSHYLRGNGQPGVVSEMTTRISSLERYRWTLSGAVAVIGFAADSLRHYLLPTK